MSIKKVGSLLADGSNLGAIYLPLSSLAVTKDTLLMADRANNVLVAATSSAATTNSLWLARETVANTATQIKVEPVTLYDLFEADATNNSASTQVLERMVLTDAATINNTETDSAVNEGIFECLGVIGAASDKKLFGRFLTLGQDADVT
jgi:hypothetical protein